jgi:hypothetical protein
MLAACREVPTRERCEKFPPKPDGLLRTSWGIFSDDEDDREYNLDGSIIEVFA